MVDSEEMPAKKGGGKEIQITARPGQPWGGDMPSWLSALLDGRNIPSGATITHQGPLMWCLRLKRLIRNVSFDIDINGTNQSITIIQSGSTLVKGEDISLNVEAVLGQISAFTATSGLDWGAGVTCGDWITLIGTTSGYPTAGNVQNITFDVSLNLLSTPRIGEITVRAVDVITGPTATITVNQSFTLWIQKERQGRNPRTGIPCMIASRRSVKFKPGNLLRDLNSFE